jgi:hypothetical protein
LTGSDSIAVESRARNNVGRERGVDVNLDSWVGLAVKRCTEDSTGCGGPRASNFQVHALWVVLSSIDLSRRVQCNDFVTKDIISRGNVNWDGEDPGVVVGNELI